MSKASDSTWKRFMKKWAAETDGWTGNQEKEMARKTARMNDEDQTLEVESSATLIDEVKRYLSFTKVKRAFGLGSELFTAATPFLDRPTWWNAAKSAFSMGKVLVEDVEVWADDYFGGDEWTEAYSSDFNQTLLHVLQKFPYERVKTAEENTFVRVCRLPGGIKVGWTYSGRMQTVDHIYTETDKLQEARGIIKQLLWQQFEGKSLVMRSNSRMVVSSDDSRVIFEVDNAFESKLSKRATELATQLKIPLTAGVSRSIMFYGPPGTGKSTLARTIVELMGLRSFRIRIGDLGGLDNATLFEAISIFEPDAVILDDFDRANGQAKLLETLEFFQQRVKLVVTTVNSRSDLDEALLRPGRIDILELVDSMDEEIVKHVLGPYSDGYPIVKDWPIAFIAEYVKRRSYMSIEEAAESVKELTKRVKQLERYRDDDNDGMERMWKLMEIKAAKKKKALAARKLTNPGDEVPEESQEARDDATAELAAELALAVDGLDEDRTMAEHDDVEDVEEVDDLPFDLG